MCAGRNSWNKKHGYPDVTANSIRHAAEEAAAAQGMEVPVEVASHLAHSIATAERNYRFKDLDQAVREGLAVDGAVHNYRLLKKVSTDPQKFFAPDMASGVYPSYEEVQARARNLLEEDYLRLSEKTYGGSSARKGLFWAFFLKKNSLLIFNFLGGLNAVVIILAMQIKRYLS